MLSYYNIFSRVHGAAEAAVGGFCSYYLSNLHVTDDTKILPYLFLGVGYLIYGYLLAEGIINVVTCQRKHHLTSTILEKAGLHNLNYKLSVPARSELEALIYDN